MKKLLFALSTITLLAAAPALDAATILVNFGNTAYSGTNAPGHVDGSATGTTWNLAAVDKASGILDQSGGATSVALDFGRATGTTLDYSLATKVSDYTMTAGNPALGGIFDTALGKSNAVRDATQPGIGLNVSGLAAGTYNFYLTTFRSEAGGGNAVQTYKNYWGVAANAITDFSAASNTAITNSNLTTWTADNNYTTGSFTIDGTNDNFSVLSTTTSGFIGVLTSLEIVAVPEPSTFAMLLGGLGMLTLLRRRA